MYRTILVATDDSPQADAATDAAIELAKRFDATLHAIYVLDSRIGRTSATKEPFKQIGENALQEIEQEAALNDVSVTTTLVEGTPASEILDYAERHAIDVIVVGGKDKSTVERFFIGTTAEKVVRHAPMSVLVVRGETEQA